MLGRAMDRDLLTARGFGRVHRLAWTAADLVGAPWPDKDHVNLALGLRIGDLLTGRSAA